MSVYFAHGGENEIITNAQKQELIQKLLEECQLEKILVLPPDITRLHSNAGQLTQLLYQQWV